MTEIDLRSDTVTLPTETMLRAMSGAPLGDDVFRDDPTVNRLQETAAQRLGKEAALFVASGTMGNLLGVLVNARSGQEIIAEASSHLFLNEAAGAAVVGGVQVRQVPTERGVLSPEQVLAALRPRSDDHQPISAAVVIENTHNRHGGLAWPVADLQRVGETARAHGLAVHMDGARIFNAEVATGTAAREIAEVADTVTFCLSKGLSCPVGSLLCGPASKIAEARKWRKMLGGGMRQAGVLAAAGLVALDTMVDRLAEDHENARTLAEGLAELNGIDCDLTRVQTNIVYFRLAGTTSADFLAESARLGLRGGATGPDQVRFVTHHGITSADIKQALTISRDALSS
ncbi:MAG TPA: GntG family PLP-dependent aldolase [Streptosporangiaceae bacterium]|nr:GntG family PLP-dependent aldolase [Streptosporangiaceae bacterium]